MGAWQRKGGGLGATVNACGVCACSTPHWIDCI
jgi:hypothetical protein